MSISRLGSLGNLFDGGLFVDIDLLVRLFCCFSVHTGAPCTASNQRACFFD